MPTRIQPILDSIHAGNWTAEHARSLLELRDPADIQALFAAAYDAKNAGRNRVMVSAATS